MSIETKKNCLGQTAKAVFYLLSHSNGNRIIIGCDFVAVMDLIEHFLR